MALLKSLGKRLFGAGDPPPYDAPLAPDAPFYAIGDIHGCLEKLDACLAAIAARPDGRSATIVFLGDYVDRGPDSAGVLARLRALGKAEPRRHVFLMGNHERMMLDFLQDPAVNNRSWLRHGGIETIASYGITKIGPVQEPEGAVAAAETLSAAMPLGTDVWLRKLRLTWTSGNVVCVHAALDPAQDLAQQSARHMLWGHPDFMSVPREDGLWVVHGHVVTQTPGIVGGRIALDTGAYKGGALTAARISSDGLELIEV